MGWLWDALHSGIWDTFAPATRVLPCPSYSEGWMSVIQGITIIFWVLIFLAIHFLNVPDIPGLCFPPLDLFFPLPILCYSPDAPAIMAFPQISEYSQLVQTCQSSSVVCLDSFPYVFPWLTHSQFSQPKSHFEKPYLTVLFTVPGYLPTEQLFANSEYSFLQQKSLWRVNSLELNPSDARSTGKPQV